MANNRMISEGDAIIELAEEFDLLYNRSKHGIDVFVEGIKVEWHWGGGHIKLGHGPGNQDDRVLILEFVEQNFDTEIKTSKSACTIIYDNPSIEDFQSVIEIVQGHSLVLSLPLGVRKGRVKPDYDNIFDKVAELVKFIVDNGLPSLISRGGGIFDQIDHLITVGRSRNWTRDNSWREHVVPCDYMMREAIDMYKQNKTLEEISLMFEQNCKIILISNEEREIIDSIHKISMPDNWTIDDPNKFIRLDVAGVEYLLEQ